MGENKIVVECSCGTIICGIADTDDATAVRG
jgi:hypothetical protein